MTSAPQADALRAEAPRSAEEKRALLARMLEKRAARPRQFPPSFSQQRLWFLDRLEPGNPTYNIWIAFPFAWQFDFGVLTSTFHEIVRRHQTLRTVFPAVDGLPVQLVASKAEAAVTVADFRGLPAEVVRAETHKVLKYSLALIPFDLSRGPLMRVALLRVERDWSILSVTMHHIVSDGWSIGVLVQELKAIYEAFAAGLPSPLPELPLQYVDFAHWQRQRLQGDGLESLLGYWRQHLAGAATLELPVDRPRPAIQSFRGSSEAFLIPGALAERLGAVSRREGATLFMTLVAAAQTLLHRYTGQEDLSFGAPIAARSNREIEGLIGLFTNTLVLRCDLSGNPTFLELLSRVRETALGAFAHQEMPFEKLVEALQPERDTSRSPLFQVAFILQNNPTWLPEQMDMLLSTLGGQRTTSKFDLTFELAEAPNGIQGVVEYNVDLFDLTTIRRLIAHLERLISAIARAPETTLRRLDLLSEAERSQVLTEWSGAGLNAACPSLLHRRFTDRASERPEAVAAIHGGEEMTYGALARRADRLAGRLRRLGIGPEQRVAVCLDRSLDLIVALLAVLKAGGAYVPVDPAYPRERKEFMLADSRAAVLLTQERWLAGLEPQTAQVVLLDRQGPEDDPAPVTEATPANLAYVIYTSGSTGRPKGVGIEHRSAAALVEWAGEVFSGPELAGVLAATSICFDLSVFEIFVPLSWGGAVILADNALALAELPAASQVTLVNTVPSAIAELARAGKIPASVRTVNLAGEPLRGALVREVYDRSRAERVLNLYGPSEDTTYSTWAAAPHTAVREPSIGRPLPGTRAYILDRDLEPVPLGAPGELCLTGNGLARGYLGRPELTAERFLPDPFATADAPGARLYRTGDLARWTADGALTYLGRLDHQVKIRGFRIELGEIEAELRRHPEVRQAVVVALPAGDGNPHLAAYVAASNGVALQTEALREHLRGRLPEYMVPAAWVVLPALPLTPNGKVDRKALPQPERPAASAAYLPPRSGAERMVAEIWQDLLGIERVGVHDNFFDLGGHSLLMAQVQSRLRERSGREVPMVELLSHASVSSLARFLAGDAKEETAGTGGAELSGPQSDKRKARLQQLRHGGRAATLDEGSQ